MNNKLTSLLILGSISTATLSAASLSSEHALSPKDYSFRSISPSSTESDSSPSPNNYLQNQRLKLLAHFEQVEKANQNPKDVYFVRNNKPIIAQRIAGETHGHILPIVAQQRESISVSPTSVDSTSSRSNSPAQPGYLERAQHLDAMKFYNNIINACASYRILAETPLAKKTSAHTKKEYALIKARLHGSYYQKLIQSPGYHTLDVEQRMTVINRITDTLNIAEQFNDHTLIRDVYSFNPAQYQTAIARMQTRPNYFTNIPATKADPFRKKTGIVDWKAFYAGVAYQDIYNNFMLYLTSQVPVSGDIHKQYPFIDAHYITQLLGSPEYLHIDNSTINALNDLMDDTYTHATKLGDSAMIAALTLCYDTLKNHNTTQESQRSPSSSSTSSSSTSSPELYSTSPVPQETSA